MPWLHALWTILQQVRGPGVLDPDIAAFAADQDAIFDQAFSARPIKEQRALYEEFWRRYHAPRPDGVEATDFNVLGLSGHIPVRLYVPAKVGSPAPGCSGAWTATICPARAWRTIPRLRSSRSIIAWLPSTNIRPHCRMRGMF